MDRKAKHPGTILRNLLQVLELTPEEFARRIGLPIKRLKGILSRQYRILNDSATAIASGFVESSLSDPYADPKHWLLLWDDFENGRPTRPSHPLDYEPSRSPREHRRIDVETREKVLELVASGMSSEEAGEEVGLKKMSVAGIRSADTKGLYS